MNFQMTIFDRLENHQEFKRELQRWTENQLLNMHWKWQRMKTHFQNRELTDWIRKSIDKYWGKSTVIEMNIHPTSAQMQAWKNPATE